MIRAKIKSETGLTASAGVSYNKFLAKLASGQNKPDGLFVITPKLGPAFVEALPVRKFHGVGPATADKMARLGIETGADLRAQSLAFLEEKFGKGVRTITGSPGASTNARCGPTASASPWRPRTPLRAIYLTSKVLARSWHHWSPRSGGIARRDRSRVAR
ncbi:hypothetical protein [Mesorhizobium sp. M0977]|uniref:Y-family DNA polymerase n=1 Tax=Mesorhizobium sp. M0977 TaxID=2957039 RepID=UPI00333A05F9